MSKYWKISVLLVVVVVCSGVAGGAIALRLQKQQLYNQVRSGPEANALRLARELRLTHEQMSSVRPILKGGQLEIRQISSNALVQVREVRRRVEADIRPLLRSDQLRRLERIAERRERIRDRWIQGERHSAEKSPDLRGPSLEQGREKRPRSPDKAKGASDAATNEEKKML